MDKIPGFEKRVVRSFKDSSDKFVEDLAKLWYNEHRLEILMVWAQGPLSPMDAALRHTL